MTATLKSPRLLTLLIPALVAAAPAPPPALAPYIHDGRFAPGDYQWLRGKFDGASAAEVAAYKALEDWRLRCRASDMAETRAELTELGVKAGASLDTIPYRTLVCDQVATEPESLNLRDWNGFARDVALVRPIAQGFLTAVAMAEDRVSDDGPELRDTLNAKVIGEQMLRSGMLWATGSSVGDVPPPALTPQQRGILGSELAIALAIRDSANTAWLKNIVAKQGWPKRSQVGKSAAKMAWLLVQHADADPAFQVRALRLMEPLVPAGEVDRRSYAYLYDRVMLKLVGTQRYATQLICEKGRLLPQPLEDEHKVDAWRREAGMETLAEYESRALKELGSCQEDPPAG